MNKDLKEGFLNAIIDTFNAYNENGARINKKLIPIPSWFAKEIISELGPGYSSMSLGSGSEGS